MDAGKLYGKIDRSSSGSRLWSLMVGLSSSWLLFFSPGKTMLLFPFSSSFRNNINLLAKQSFFFCHNLKLSLLLFQMCVMHDRAPSEWISHSSSSRKHNKFTGREGGKKGFLFQKERILRYLWKNKHPKYFYGISHGVLAYNVQGATGCSFS